MKPWAVLFDLDDTLVDTALLKPLRDARRWPEVYAALTRTTLEPGTREMLAATSRVAEIGVVTMAPRTYAERLLRHHNLAVPVLVAYHDVPRSQLKPHPRPLEQAAEHLGLSPQRVVYVGDDVRDVMSALAAGATALAYRARHLESDPRAAGSFFADDWQEVSTVLREIING